MASVKYWQVWNRSLTVSTLAPYELFKMKIFLFFLILSAKFVVNIVAYYRQCYESFSLCLITNIEDVEKQYWLNSKCTLSQSSAADWCERNSSSLAIITNATVQSAVTEFISDSSARFESDVITDGYRLRLSNMEWINGIISQSSYWDNDFGYAYLYVSVDKTVASFYGHATTKRKFICSYKVNYNSRCSHGFRKLNMTCYIIRNENVTWYDARNHCLKDERSDLAIFDSGLPPLTSERRLTEQYWIGLSGESWNWKYAYAKMKYSNWNDASPRPIGGYCLCLRVPSGRWTDCDCNRNYRFICMQAFSTTTTKLPAVTTTASTTPSTTTITFPTVGDPSSKFHSTLAPSDDLSYKASGEPENTSESEQSSGVVLVLGIGGVCLLLLIGIILAIVVIKTRQSRSGDIGTRQQDYPPQHIYETDVPNNVYAMVVPNTGESARSPSERNHSEIVYAELDLAPAEKMTQRYSTPGKTQNQIFYGPAPKGSKRGISAAPESEYANSIPLESVYDNIAPS